MEKVLIELAKKFNKADIQWGIGGSLLLRHFNLTDRANDIDVIISESSFDNAIQILEGFAIEKISIQKQEYSTKHYKVYEIHGIDLDIISGFTINHESGSYELIFDAQSITDRIEINDTILPYTSLEDWYVLYMLMKCRENKVNLIEEYFKSYGIKNSQLLTRALKQNLPTIVRDRINEILYS